MEDGSGPLRRLVELVATSTSTIADLANSLEEVEKMAIRDEIAIQVGRAIVILKPRIVQEESQCFILNRVRPQPLWFWTHEKIAGDCASRELAHLASRGVQKVFLWFYGQSVPWVRLGLCRYN